MCNFIQNRDHIYVPSHGYALEICFAKARGGTPLTTLAVSKYFKAFKCSMLTGNDWNDNTKGFGHFGG